MSTTPEQMENIFSKISFVGPLRYQKLFGGYGLYYDEIFIGVVCDNSLFLKITSISSDFLDDSHKFPAYTGAKDSMKIPGVKLDDKIWIEGFIQQTANQLKNKKKLNK